MRVTAIVVEDGNRLLLLNQDTESERSWSRPGGKIEPGRDAEQAPVRELRADHSDGANVDALLS